MAELLYNLAVMDEAAAQLTGLKGDLSILEGKLNEAGEQAQNFWIGFAGRAFLEKNEAIRQNIEQYRGDIARVHDALTEAADTYRIQEEGQVKKISELDTSGIF